MKLVPKTLVLSAVAASLCLGVAGTARADVFASSILTINNFRLLHANGSAFAPADFDLLAGSNFAHATASLNAGTSTAVPLNVDILSGSNTDITHQFVGLPSPPRAENNFAPFPNPPAVPGTFGYADQFLTGSALQIGPNPAGALAQTRADASLQTNGMASGDSDVGTLTTFSFSLANAEALTFAFDATPYTQAYATAGGTNAIARVSWSLSIRNPLTNALIFSFQPGQLNGDSAISRTGAFAGMTTYNPGTFSFSALSPLLNPNDTYQLTIQHNTLANVSQVPEPATLAIFGFGLLGMAALRRRRAA
ncbi:MAG: PEP-CTERM sorting domain-containing protein [Pseudomonadota bacterium]